MMKKFLLIPVIFFLTVVVLSPLTVSAQTGDDIQENREEITQNREEIRQDIEESREELREQRDENITQRCENAVNRIDTIIQRYNENRLRYVNRYNALFARLNNLSAFLDENNVDTLNLSNQISELNSLVADFNSNVDLTISNLENSKNFVCGESQGEYRAVIAEAKGALLETRSTAIEINQYFLFTIVPELEEIRDNYQTN